MPPEGLSEARDWLLRSERDLRLADRSLFGDETFPDDAAFHAQQAVEKALKGYLSAHDHPFPKTHDLARLIDWCEDVSSGFNQFMTSAQVLTPFAVRFRHPGSPLEPELAEAQEAIQFARELVSFVQLKLAGEFPGQSFS